MNDIAINKAFDIVHSIAGEQHCYDPQSLCKHLGISVVYDKPLHKDGYLICSDGLKLIFISNRISNRHRIEFIIAHELGHYLMHQDAMYCCSNVHAIPTMATNTSSQEREANHFATEILIPSKSISSLLPQRSISYADISSIANKFNVSMSHAAIKAVQNSKTENEVLICYEGQMLKWFVISGPNHTYRAIPNHCPVDLSSIPDDSYVSNYWDSIYSGKVRQEVFHPYNNQSLILLSGTMIEEGSS